MLLDSEFINQLICLQSGVGELLSYLPKTSHMCQLLLHFLVKYLPVKVAAFWFSTSELTIKQVQVMNNDELNVILLSIERFVSDTK